MDLRTLFIILHVIGTCVGAGAATVGDMLVLKFLRNGRLEKDEFQTLKYISHIVIGGLGILLITGLGFLVLVALNWSNAQYHVPKVGAKLTIVGVLIINGILLHARVLPVLKKSIDKPLVKSPFAKNLPLIFTTGAISAVSWYSALILGAWRNFTASYTTTMISYLTILILAIMISNLLGRNFIRQLKKR